MMKEKKKIKVEKVFKREDCYKYVTLKIDA